MKRGKSRMRSRQNLLRQYEIGQKSRAATAKGKKLRSYQKQNYDGHDLEETTEND